mgnify:CR=1 FL=1
MPANDTCRIGVYICHCGLNIASKVDVPPPLPDKVDVLPRAKSPRDDLLRMLAYAACNQLGGYKKVLPVSTPAAQQNVRVRVVGVVVVDRNPFERCPRFGLQSRHDLPNERAKITESRTILGADNEPEVAGVIDPGRGQGFAIEIALALVVK